MDKVNSICPICEGLNPSRSMACRHCGQDMRINPLSDFNCFVNKTPSQQKEDLAFQFGTLKHKLNLSYNTLRILSEHGKTSRLNRVFKYYRRMVELEVSSSTYYLLLCSRELFYRYYGTLMMNVQSYFVLWQTYLMRSELPVNSRIDDLFEKGLRMIEAQREKLVKIVEVMIDSVDLLETEKMETGRWKSPPPPAICWMLTGIGGD